MGESQLNHRKRPLEANLRGCLLTSPKIISCATRLMCMNALTSFTKALWSAGRPLRRYFPTSRMCLPKQRDHWQHRQCEDPLPQACLDRCAEPLDSYWAELNTTVEALLGSAYQTLSWALKPTNVLHNLSQEPKNPHNSFQNSQGRVPTRRQRIIEI